MCRNDNGQCQKARNDLRRHVWWIVELQSHNIFSLRWCRLNCRWWVTTSRNFLYRKFVWNYNCQTGTYYDDEYTEIGLQKIILQNWFVVILEVFPCNDRHHQKQKKIVISHIMFFFHRFFLPSTTNGMWRPSGIFENKELRKWKLSTIK